jgi:hypothetical protein
MGTSKSLIFMRNSSAHRSGPARQRGLSVIALLFFGILIAGLLVFAFKLVRPITEYLAIESAIQKITREGATVTEIRTAFDRHATIDDITSIGSKDLEITKEGDQIVVSYAYPYTIQVLDNVRLVIDFSGTTRDRPAKGGR